MKTLAERIKDFEFPSFVYSYPPPRTYTALHDFSLDNVVFTPEVNIYIHIPFCEQKCTFCPYLTVIGRSEDFQDAYVDSIVKEIELYHDVLLDKTIRTVNFGGGTPSLLTPAQLEKILGTLAEVNPNLLTTTQEISIETTPETVDYEKFAAFRKLGLNRASMGVQALNNEEIRLSKRHNWADVSIRALEILKKAGIPNICCDLMYGIEGQTINSWEKSVVGLLEYRPETIELFALVVRSMTPLGIKQSKLMGNQEKYACFALAQAILQDSGYSYDAHTFNIPGKGGYRQQANAFDEQSVIGFGVGARTYGLSAYYRNTYNTRFSKQATAEYMKNIASGRFSVDTGIIMDQEEHMRRYVIYHLENLDKKDFRRKFGINFDQKFGQTVSEIVDLDLADQDGDAFKLTGQGIKFRDLISHELFSEHAKQVEKVYERR